MAKHNDNVSELPVDAFFSFIRAAIAAGLDTQGLSVEMQDESSFKVLLNGEFAVSVTENQTYELAGIDNDTIALSTGDRKLKTHEVLDLTYHVEEGQGCFDGTKEDCESFVQSQPSPFTLKIVPMLQSEIENHPDNEWFYKNKAQ